MEVAGVLATAAVMVVAAGAREVWEARLEGEALARNTVAQEGGARAAGALAYLAQPLAAAATVVMTAGTVGGSGTAVGEVGSLASATTAMGWVTSAPLAEGQLALMRQRIQRSANCRRR